MADLYDGPGAAAMESPAPQPYQPPVGMRLVPDDGEPVDTTQSVQSAVEGVVEEEDDPSLVEFMGKRFRMADNVALMPLLKFAHASKKGLDSDDMEGLDAMYRLIRSTLDRTKVQAVGDTGEPEFDEAGDPVWDGPSQWELFEEHADETGAEGQDLMDFVNKVMPLISARPRKPRGDSAHSSRQISATSRGSSSSPDTDPRYAGLTPVADLGKD